MDKRQTETTESKFDTSIVSSAAGSGISLLALIANAPKEGNVGKLSAPQLLGFAAGELKNELIPDFIKAEKTLLKDGWTLHSVNGERYWSAPEGRAFEPSRSGGYKVTEVTPASKQFIQEKELGLVNQGQAPGHFTSSRRPPFPEQSLYVKNFEQLRVLANSNGEFERLTNLEKRVYQPFSPSDSLLKPTLYEQHAAKHTYQQFDFALTQARNEVQAQSQVFQKALRESRINIGVLVGSEGVNIAMNNFVFDKTPMSVHSHIVNGASPLVALTRLSWQAKLGLIVGSQLTSRSIDYYQAKTGR